MVHPRRGHPVNSPYLIRPAAPPDLPELLTLCAEHAAYEGASYDPDGKAERLARALFADPPTLHCLVVSQIDHPARLAGYAAYRPEFSTWDAAWFMHMDCLFLRPEARRHGLGSRLLDRIIDHARQLGCVNVQWQTPSTNTSAIAFYEAHHAIRRDKVRFTLPL